MKENKLTVIGSVDPVDVVSKLRKYWQTDIVSVGPAKEPEKKEEAKKEEPKKEDAPKEEPKKEGEEKKPEQEPKKEEDKEKKKEDEGKKEEATKKDEEPKKPPLPVPLPMPMPYPYWSIPPPDPRVMAHRTYNPHMTNYYYAPSMEENPNACVIC